MNLSENQIKTFQRIHKKHNVSLDFLAWNFGKVVKCYKYATSLHFVIRKVLKRRGDRVWLKYNYLRKKVFRQKKRPNSLWPKSSWTVSYREWKRNVIGREKANKLEKSDPNGEKSDDNGITDDDIDTDPSLEEASQEDVQRKLKEELEILKSGKRTNSLLEVSYSESLKEATHPIAETSASYNDCRIDYPEIELPPPEDFQDSDDDCAIVEKSAQREDLTAEASDVESSFKKGKSFLDSLISKIGNQNNCGIGNQKSIRRPSVLSNSKSPARSPNERINGIEEENSSHSSADFLGFNESDLIPSNVPGMLPTPNVINVSGKSAFVSETLDNFMRDNSLENPSKLEIPKRRSFEEGLVYSGAVPPKLTITKIPEELKPRTLAEKRTMLQNQRNVKYWMIENENVIYREIKKRSSGGKVDKEVVRYVQTSKVPSTRDCWKAAAWAATEDGRFYFKTLNIDGEEFKLMGGSGDYKVKQLTKQTSKPSERKLFPHCPPKCNQSDDFKNIRFDFSSQIAESPTGKKSLSKEEFRVADYKKITARRIVDTNYKAGPLSEKLKSLDIEPEHLSLGPLEIYEMPLIELEVFPELDKPLDDFIKPYLKMINPFTNISREWAEFSVSTLVQKKTSEKNESGQEDPPRRVSFKFPIPYANNQKRILVRKRIPKREIKLEGDFDDNADLKFRQSIDSEDLDQVDCADMIGEMINSVAMGLSEDTFIKDDPDINYSTKNIENAGLVAKAVGEHDKKARKGRTRNKIPPRMRLLTELKRLNHTIIDADYGHEEGIENCNQEFCKFGCVCQSLRNSTLNSLRKHCKNVECMFECSCNFPQTLEGQNIGEDLTNEDALLLREKATARLAKVEREFCSTIVLTDNKTYLINESHTERRRTVKAPKRYDDFLEEEERVVEQRAVKRMVLSQEEAKIEKLFKHCNVRLRRLVDLEKLETWCMVHCLYKCYCQNKATSGNPFSLCESDESTLPNVPVLTRRAAYTFAREESPTEARTHKPKENETKTMGNKNQSKDKLREKRRESPRINVTERSLRQETREKVESPKKQLSQPKKPTTNKHTERDLRNGKLLRNQSQRAESKDSSTDETVENAEDDNNLLMRMSPKPSTPGFSRQTQSDLQRKLRYYGQCGQMESSRTCRIPRDVFRRRNKSRLANILKRKSLIEDHASQKLLAFRIAKSLQAYKTAQPAKNTQLNKETCSSSHSMRDQQPQYSESNATSSTINQIPTRNLNQSVEIRNMEREPSPQFATVIERNSLLRKLVAQQKLFESEVPAAELPKMPVISSVCSLGQEKINSDRELASLRADIQKANLPPIQRSGVPVTIASKRSVSIEENSKPTALLASKSAQTTESQSDTNLESWVSTEDKVKHGTSLADDPEIAKIIQSTQFHTNNIIKLNVAVTKTMHSICHIQKTSNKNIPDPVEKALSSHQWQYFLQAYVENLIYVWEIKIDDITILAVTRTNMMPQIPSALSVINIKAIKKENLPLIGRMLNARVINDRTKSISVLMTGELGYWRIIGFINSTIDYLKNGCVVRPTPLTHPRLSEKINTLFKVLMAKEVTALVERRKMFSRTLLSAPNSVSIDDSNSATGPVVPNEATKCKFNGIGCDPLPPSNIQIKKISENELHSIYVPIPVIGNHRWLMLTMFDDFSHIYLPSWKNFLSVDKIKKAIHLASQTKKTVRLGQGGSGVDVYATPESLRRIYFGPFSFDRKCDILLYQNMDGRMMLREYFQSLQNIKPDESSTGCWLYMKNDELLIESRVRTHSLKSNSIPSDGESSVPDVCTKPMEVENDDDDCQIVEEIKTETEIDNDACSEITTSSAAEITKPAMKSHKNSYSPMSSTTSFAQCSSSVISSGQMTIKSNQENAITTTESESPDRRGSTTSKQLPMRYKLSPGGILLPISAPSSNLNSTESSIDFVSSERTYKADKTPPNLAERDSLIVTEFKGTKNCIPPVLSPQEHSGSEGPKILSVKSIATLSSLFSPNKLKEALLKGDRPPSQNTVLQRASKSEKSIEPTSPSTSQLSPVYPHRYHQTPKVPVTKLIHEHRNQSTDVQKTSVTCPVSTVTSKTATVLAADESSTTTAEAISTVQQVAGNLTVVENGPSRKCQTDDTNPLFKVIQKDGQPSILNLCVGKNHRLSSATGGPIRVHFPSNQGETSTGNSKPQPTVLKIDSQNQSKLISLAPINNKSVKVIPHTSNANRIKAWTILKNPATISSTFKTNAGITVKPTPLSLNSQTSPSKSKPVIKTILPQPKVITSMPGTIKVKSFAHLSEEAQGLTKDTSQHIVSTISTRPPPKIGSNVIQMLTPDLTSRSTSGFTITPVATMDNIGAGAAKSKTTTGIAEQIVKPLSTTWERSIKTATISLSAKNSEHNRYLANRNRPLISAVTLRNKVAQLQTSTKTTPAASLLSTKTAKIDKNTPNPAKEADDRSEDEILEMQEPKNPAPVKTVHGFFVSNIIALGKIPAYQCGDEYTLIIPNFKGSVRLKTLSLTKKYLQEYLRLHVREFIPKELDLNWRFITACSNEEKNYKIHRKSNLTVDMIVTQNRILVKRPNPLATQEVTSASSSRTEPSTPSAIKSQARASLGATPLPNNKPRVQLLPHQEQNWSITKITTSDTSNSKNQSNSQQCTKTSETFQRFKIETQLEKYKNEQKKERPNGLLQQSADENSSINKLIARKRLNSSAIPITSKGGPLPAKRSLPLAAPKKSTSSDKIYVIDSDSD